MNITEVKQNWREDTMRIDLTIGNICNYKCWYCFPGCNTGDIKWPDFDSFVENLSHMLDYYIEMTSKTKFDFHVMGGEITHWKKFQEFIVYFKTRYNCIFTLTTNGTKKLSWWEEMAPYLDYVILSSHHEFVDPVHLSNVADLLYEKNVIVTTIVLMDPFAWDTCMSHVNYYTTSKHRWSIRYMEIVEQSKVKYTDEQKAILNKGRARSPNLFWFFKNNKSSRSNVRVVDEAGKTHKLKDHEIIHNKLNNFNGWECNLGIDWIAIRMDGTLTGLCSNKLYGKQEQYNIFDANFKEKFQPLIEPAKCERTECWCMFEANMTKKVIPIYVN